MMGQNGREWRKEKEESGENVGTEGNAAECSGMKEFGGSGEKCTEMEESWERWGDRGGGVTQTPARKRHF